MARCQKTNTYHTRHIYTLATHDNVWGFDKQISRRSTSATDTTVNITSCREYKINFVCKRLPLFLSYTVSIVSSEETSRSRHIMAQSAATKLPLVHPAEAPAQTSTSITTIHRNPVTSPEEVPINVYLPLNPVLTITAPGPAVASVTDTPSDSSPDSSIPQGNANATADDEDDIWLTMAMTFNDLYQGLTEDDVPPLTEVNDANAPANNNNDITDSGPLFTNDDQLEVCRNLFSTQFHCGFNRVIDIDQAATKLYLMSPQTRSPSWNHAKPWNNFLTGIRHWTSPSHIFVG